MKFLLIISHDDAFAPSDTLIEEIFAWIKEMKRKGIRVDGNPLRPASEAKTVRVRNGKVRVSPGPFEDSEEKMCAYELLECESLDEATRAASKHPMARDATIEVRPIWAEMT